MPTKRKIFYSFHFDNDVFRVHQIRNIGALEDNKPVTANAWEEVKKGGDIAIKRWIDGNMAGKSCIVVLVGEDTVNRPWVRYEIKKAWEEGRGIVGIYIHNLKCMVHKKNHPYTNGKCSAGKNPFSTFTFGTTNLSSVINCYDPCSSDSYGDIKNNLEGWIEEAIKIRSNFR